MKVMGKIVDEMIRAMIDIDEIQYSFVPGREITNAIFIIRQLQEKFLAKKKKLYLLTGCQERLCDGP